MPSDPTTDPRVDAYIAGRAAFARPILSHLRARIHAALPEAGETIKWGMPFFTLAGRPLANMAAFKAHASFGFWDRSENATGREGEAMGQFGRLTNLADLPDDATLDALIGEAAGRIAAGAATRRTPAAAKPAIDVPPAFVAALAGDAEAKATFDAFPPSCRRDYCAWIAEAKRDATRDKRIGEAIAWLREGKRRNWKYEAC